MSENQSKVSIYKGYLMKSLLEKKWAVFWDACNYTWYYEPAFFELGDGERYTPDFYIVDLDLFVEIKPFPNVCVNHAGDGNIFEQKCERFRDATGKAILICYGYPFSDLFKVLFAYDHTDSAGGVYTNYCNFIVHNNEIVLCTGDDRKDRVICTRINGETSQKLGTIYQLGGGPELIEEMVQLYNYKADDILNRAKAQAWYAKQYD